MSTKRLKGKPCPCGDSTRYVLRNKCVNCIRESTLFRDMKRRAKKVTPKEFELACKQGAADNPGLNPYEYNAEIGKFCAWQAGFNDSRATVNH